MASGRLMTKIAGFESRSRSISQRHGSADQNPPIPKCHGSATLVSSFKNLNFVHMISIRSSSDSVWVWTQHVEKRRIGQVVFVFLFLRGDCLCGLTNRPSCAHRVNLFHCHAQYLSIHNIRTVPQSKIFSFNFDPDTYFQNYIINILEKKNLIGKNPDLWH